MCFCCIVNHLNSFGEHCFLVFHCIIMCGNVSIYVYLLKKTDTQMVMKIHKGRTDKQCFSVSFIHEYRTTLDKIE